MANANNFSMVSEKPWTNADMHEKAEEEDNLNDCSFSTCKSAASNKKGSPQCNDPFIDDSFSSDNDMDDQ